jgi:hypothetical protein
MTNDLEPIVLVFPSGKRVQLARETTEKIWAAVRRGWYSSPQQLIDVALAAALNSPPSIENS